MNKLVTCHRCDAKYNKDARWSYGWYGEGTAANNFIKAGDVKEGHCPICCKPPLLEKPIEHRMTM